MKNLHIINTLANGGAQSVLLQILEGSSECQQMVISLRHREQLSARIEAINISVEHIDLIPGKIEPRKLLRLVRIIQTYKPDVVQTWLYHADLLGSIATRFAGSAPIVWGIHHTISDKYSVKSSTWNIIQLLSQLSPYMPSRIICCSQSAYQTHANIGYSKNKLVTILNGIDTDRFHPDPFASSRMRIELGLPIRTKLIGMFARYHEQKDHDTFIRAASILLKRNPAVHFVFAGEGIDPANKQLQEKIFRERIQTNTHLLGIRQDMPKLNAGMDIVTLSSSYGEALPMTLGEAMSCATPCVATNVGDTATLIGKTGIVVEPKNPQALADAWQNILEYSDMEYNDLGVRARQRILEMYNLANMVNGYKSIYQGLKDSP